MAMSPRFRRRAAYFQDTKEIPGIVRLWLLRMLVPLGGHRRFIGDSEFCTERLAELLGLGDWLGCEYEEFKPKAILGQLRKLHHEAERTAHNTDFPRIMAENIARLSMLTGLSDLECRVLQFAVTIHSEPVLDDTADFLGDLSADKVPRVLAALLGLPEQDIRLSLSPKGGLAGSGLVTLEQNGNQTLKCMLNLLSSRFASAIMSSVTDPVTLLSDIVTPAGSPTLLFDDFEHIGASLRILRPYLRHVVAARRNGVNIFLYGPPGTGKSELSKLLAKNMKCELFEVTSEDDDGNPIHGTRRLRAYRAAQNFFSGRQAFLLFDEAEDVFTHEYPFFAEGNRRQECKGWVNRMLESNPQPTIWVSNSVRDVDPAVIRRFDMVIELPIPPRGQRERIARHACGDILPPSSLRRIAESEQLAPAVITRAASVVKCIRKELGDNAMPAAVESLISNTLVAQGHDAIRRSDANHLPETYDPAFINADADLVAAADGLVKTKVGRLCLYGPPGTGKTAFGRWLADHLGVPLCVKRGSDLLSMWVGGTEQNIARAFREAAQDGALLLIDEVDSFLQDRRRAQRSWEVTVVNEMLTQMESFSGVFIASTNLMDGLDQASLRRFDLKVRCDFLRADQAWQLFRRHCAELSLSAPSADLKSKLARLTCLTPGDFASVARQSRFSPLKNPENLIDALEKECLVKENGTSKNFGFF